MATTKLLHPEVEASVRQLKGALLDVMVSVGADPRRPQTIHRRFQLDRVLCWKVSRIEKATAAEDGIFEKRIAVLGVGDVFGEMELIDMQRRSATVRALEAVSVLALSNGDLFRIYESDLPTFTLIVLNLARELSRRLRSIDDLAVHYMAIGSREQSW